jgi:hypothetical protein
MMHRTKLLGWAAALLLGIASTAFALADSPSGTPPFGVIADGTSGTQLEGVVTIVFRDFSGIDLKAPRFDTVTRLRKGNAYNVFYAEYDCAEQAAPDPCAICDGNDLIDVSQVAPIQLCIQDLIEADALTKFGFTEGDVRLKNVSGFSSDPDPVGGIPERLVAAADVVVTVK